MHTLKRTQMYMLVILKRKVEKENTTVADIVRNAFLEYILCSMLFA